VVRQWLEIPKPDASLVKSRPTAVTPAPMPAD
jgi:hypothetical protein